MAVCRAKSTTNPYRMPVSARCRSAPHDQNGASIRVRQCWPRMTVHSRGAAKETVGLLAQAGQRALLHWYSGDLATADDALTAGLWFSVNPSMTRSAKGRSLIDRLPPQRVLCETGWPVLHHGRQAGSPGRRHGSRQGPRRSLVILRSRRSIAPVLQRGCLPRQRAV